MCWVEPGFPLSSQWQYASVTGVSSIYKVNDATFLPCVLVKEDSSVLTTMLVNGLTHNTYR